MRDDLFASKETDFLRAILHSSNAPIIVTDARAAENPVVFVNPAFVKATGYAAEEVVGKTDSTWPDRQSPAIRRVSEPNR
jgi:PAS domain S-box-containing protein